MIHENGASWPKFLSVGICILALFGCNQAATDSLEADFSLTASDLVGKYRYPLLDGEHTLTFKPDGVSVWKFGPLVEGDSGSIFDDQYIVEEGNWIRFIRLRIDGEAVPDDYHYDDWRMHVDAITREGIYMHNDSKPHGDADSLFKRID